MVSREDLTIEYISRMKGRHVFQTIGKKERSRAPFSMPPSILLSDDVGPPSWESSAGSNTTSCEAGASRNLVHRFHSRLPFLHPLIASRNEKVVRIGKRQRENLTLNQGFLPTHYTISHMGVKN